ncbi:MAG: hypothetical protein Kow0040_06860 [Thermogutta sp.]
MPRTMVNFRDHVRKLEFFIPAVLLVVYLGVWLIPTLRETTLLRRRISDLQPNSAGAPPIRERIQQVAAKLDNVEKFLRPWQSAASPEVALAAFLREATLTGESEGVDFSRVAPRSLQNIGWMSVSEIEFHLSGKTENIIRFLRTLDDHRRPTVVKSVRLAREPGSNLVSCQLVLSVFSINSNYSD